MDKGVRLKGKVGALLQEREKKPATNGKLTSRGIVSPAGEKRLETCKGRSSQTNITDREEQGAHKGIEKKKKKRHRRAAFETDA